MTKYLVEVPDDLWRAFRTVTFLQGLKIKDAVPKAITEFIQTHQVSEVRIDLKVIEDNKRNLLTFVYEEEIKNLLFSLIEARKRHAPLPYLRDLKGQMLKTVKKHPQISKQLAQEIVTTLKAIT